MKKNVYAEQPIYICGVPESNMIQFHKDFFEHRKYQLRGFITYTDFISQIWLALFFLSKLRSRDFLLFLSLSPWLLLCASVTCCYQITTLLFHSVFSVILSIFNFVNSSMINSLKTCLFLC